MPGFDNIILTLPGTGDYFLPANSPYYGKRMLRKEVEEYLIEEAELRKRTDPLFITLDFQNKPVVNKTELAAAIHGHFAYKRKLAHQEIRKWINRGWKSLLIAFIFLGLVFFVFELSSQYYSAERIPLTIKEFFIIIAWVALWKPADLLLYEWRPYKREAALFERLEKSKVEVL